jgi:hypothetical protein
MLCVARRATCLADFVANHCHNRVIRQAALTRAVVIQNVTEP